MPLTLTDLGRTRLREALHNASPDVTRSAPYPSDSVYSNERYARGVVLGCVAAYMSLGHSFDDAWALVQSCLPEDVDPRCLPWDRTA